MSQQPMWMETLLDTAIFEKFTGTHVEKVELVQTHISWVFLAGDRVFKIKKPVDFGFLDFSTLEKRHEFCNAELRLNRRLCPDIYLDVIPLVRTEAGFALNQDGEVCEWVLVMKRMPQEGLMNRLLEQDEVTGRNIDMIVEKLVPFYDAAASGPEVQEMGSVETITHNTEENFEQTQAFVDDIIPKDTFEAIASYTRDFIKTKRELFDRRISTGKIREGHGDLYSANICFERKREDVYIFDCIEFNQRFRCGDIASDVAFLAMDLDHFGLPQLSDYFIQTYTERADDPELLDLNTFYKCYRAYVRGKIGCFTAGDPGVDQATREACRRQAANYFKLALKYAGAAPEAHLYCFFGLSGSGKSTLARAWAERHGMPVYNSDRVRKEIVAGIPATESHIEPFGKGIYSKEMSEKTYRAISRLAGSHIVRGESAIVDATYTERAERDRLIELAEAAGARIHFIFCSCSEDVIRERLAARQTEDGSVSDGRWEIYLKQKEHFADPASLPGMIRVDTSMPVEDALNFIENAL